jgi:hypothetical protein
MLLDNPTDKRVPRSIFVIILAIFASMYYYAAFVDLAEPEETVTRFYQAYFAKDFDTVADNVSVFWSLQLLPHYGTLTPSQLLENREFIEKETSFALKRTEEKNEIPDNISIKIMRNYTREEDICSVVLYTFLEDNKPTGVGMAILVQEEGQYRIYNLSRIDTEDLPRVKEIDLQGLSQSFKDLYKL